MSEQQQPLGGAVCVGWHMVPWPRCQGLLRRVWWPGAGNCLCLLSPHQSGPWFWRSWGCLGYHSQRSTVVTDWQWHKETPSTVLPMKKVFPRGFCWGRHFGQENKVWSTFTTWELLMVACAGGWRPWPPNTWYPFSWGPRTFRITFKNVQEYLRFFSREEFTFKLTFKLTYNGQKLRGEK